jgi:hypothetical protein
MKRRFIAVGLSRVWWAWSTLPGRQVCKKLVVSPIAEKVQIALDVLLWKIVPRVRTLHLNHRYPARSHHCPDKRIAIALE